MDLEIAIIKFISQIPMSIWLYDDGRNVVASTIRSPFASRGAASSSGERHVDPVESRHAVPEPASHHK